MIAHDMDNSTGPLAFGPYSSALRSASIAEDKMLCAGLSDEDSAFVAEHWFQFKAPPDSAYTAVALLHVFMMVASMIGNGLVIYIFSTTKNLRTPSNMLILQLAIFDFAMMIKAPLFIYNCIKRGFAMGAQWCRIFALFGSINGFGCAITNACIAYDRHSAITRPLDGRLSRGKAILMIIFTWVYISPWCILPMLEVWGKFGPEGFLASCTFDYLTDTFETKLVAGSMFTCCYVIPLSFIFYYYSGIVKKVFAHEAALREQAKKMNVDSLRANQNASAESAEIRIAKAALTVCFLYVSAWTPYGIMFLVGAFGDRSLLTPVVTMVPAVTCKLVACIDPWVYAISHPKYRQELQKRMPWLQIDEPCDSTSISSTTTVTTSNVPPVNAPPTA